MITSISQEITSGILVKILNVQFCPFYGVPPRYDMLRGGPDVTGDAGLPETHDGDGIRARRMVMTELDLVKFREYYPDFGN